MTPLIPRNSPIPTLKSQVFSTANDNQETVTIQVFEGERSKAKDNHPLGRFDLTGIRKAPRGKPQIEVSFQVDANGILKVKAVDKDTGKQNDIVIDKSDGSLSTEDIDRMIKEGEAFAEEDKKFKLKIESKQKLETVAYSAKNQMDEIEANASDALAEEERSVVVSECDEAIKWLENNQSAESDVIDDRLAELE